mmetsp:Transcript_1353/g.2910  ORF Transcript_1353/g.2910 Transcript_1353/m.2910 type:complete len:348 (-) Transcript_1353:137-1180(-)
MDAQASALTKRARKVPASAETAAYPGDVGSLAHIAAVRFFESCPAVRLKGVRSFSNVFDAVTSEEASYGVVPIENSASGTLHSTYDLLFKHDVTICSELGVRERYCLCARPGGGLADVRRVLSHPGILEACSGFIESRWSRESGVDLVPMFSTTEAACRASTGESDGVFAAAVATREAATHRALTVLAEDIGNDTLLETRYIVICRRSSCGSISLRPAPFPQDITEPLQKRSACFALANEPGAIFKLLSCWALRGINILKLETRPLGAGHRVPQGLPAGLGRLWEYLFYVEYAVPAAYTEEANKRLWEALEEFSLWQRDFGTYPSMVTQAARQSRSWPEMVDLMAKG